MAVPAHALQQSGGAAFLDYQYQALGIAAYMDAADVTEICINRPGEVWLERRGGWQRVAVPA